MYKLFHAVQSKNSGMHERRICIKHEEQTILEKCIINLREELSDSVSSKNPSNIRKAQQMAIQSEVWLDERKKIRKPRIHNKLPLPNRPNHFKPLFKIPNFQPNTHKYPSINNPLNPSMPLQERLQIFCSHCKKPGYTKNQCFPKQRNFLVQDSGDRHPNRVNFLLIEDTTEEEVTQRCGTEEIEYPQYQKDFIFYQRKFTRNSKITYR